MKYLFPVFFIAFFSCGSSKQITPITVIRGEPMIIERKDLQHYFTNCGTPGSTVLFDKNKIEWIVTDSLRVNQGSLPASTFKIINLLIALETKVISSEFDVVKWPGSTDTVKYGYRPDIYHDMTVKEAFELSAGWVFVELAKKIGQENYQKYLTKCNYGNANLTHPDTDFWNFGPLAISPMNQVQLVMKLYDNRLPFAKEHMETVKRVMVTEKNDRWTIHSKTGWTRDSDINTGWWVGYVETNDNVIFFATLLKQPRASSPANFGNCRKEITKSILRKLGYISSK